LLRKLDVTLTGDDAQFMARLDSFGMWLIQHATGQVMQLGLELATRADYNYIEAWSTVGAALTLCGADSLTALRLVNIEDEVTTMLGAWAGALLALRSLEVICEGDIYISDGMEHLTAMQRLQLGSADILLADGACLPTSLTSLKVEDRGDPYFRPFPKVSSHAALSSSFVS
jgi:hypothetical protein